MDEADARLAYYLPPPSIHTQTEEQTPSRPQLPEGTVDTPLVRVYNFLRMFIRLKICSEDETVYTEMMSLSYQLEILWYQVPSFISRTEDDSLQPQAERMRFLGWKDYLAVNMSPNRKTLTTSYWLYVPFVSYRAAYSCKCTGALQLQ
jgi:mediator of RNA polymerase II transcription subunit 14